MIGTLTVVLSFVEDDCFAIDFVRSIVDVDFIFAVDIFFSTGSLLIFKV